MHSPLQKNIQSSLPLSPMSDLLLLPQRAKSFIAHAAPIVLHFSITSARYRMGVFALASRMASLANIADLVILARARRLSADAARAALPFLEIITMLRIKRIR